jgi:uncharacterized protein
MLYRKNPRNGDELSILGFGCMRLPVKADGAIDEERAAGQLRRAIDRGVNYVDTAWPYHGEQSEPFVGRALAGGYREKVKLATKLPSWITNSRDDMDRFLDAQLGKLNTGRIDYYLLHALAGPVWDTLSRLGATGFLDRAKSDGRIGSAGFSFHGTAEDFRRIVDAYNWDFCQIQYNYLDEENQAGTAGLEYAAVKGLAVIVMEPLRGGSLSGLMPPGVKEIWDEALVKRTPAEWALRWVWNRPEVTVVLSGMNEETHVEENLAVADVAHPNSLTSAELRLVKRVEQRFRESMKAGCTGCRYCMPCPQGVNIPSCFDTYNALSMGGSADQVKFMYALRMSGVLSFEEPGFASQCIQCGECLEKCPQHLEITALLESVVKELEGPDLDKRIAAAKQMFGRT